MMTERLINFQYDGESDPYAPNIEIIVNRYRFNFLISLSWLRIFYFVYLSYNFIKHSNKYFDIRRIIG